jgi:probable phosphoglycerate mutase
MIAIIRHGRAVGNSEHRFIGWSDVPLDATGEAQSERVAPRLAEAGIERIVSSDIRRAVQTAAPLARLTGLDVETDRRLREIDNGEWTGLTPDQISARWPDLWASYVGGTDVHRPRGERWVDVRRRIVEALEEMGADGRPTVAITHAGPILLAAAWALKIGLPGNIFTGPLAIAGNTSVTTVEAGKLVCYADAGHLGSVPGLDIPYEPVE